MNTSNYDRDLSSLEIQEKILGNEPDASGYLSTRFRHALELAGEISRYADNAQYNKAQTMDLAQAVFLGLTRVANVWIRTRPGERNLGLAPSLKLFFRVLNEIEEALSRHARQGFLRRMINKSDDLEELKRLDVGLSEALSYFLTVSHLPVPSQEKNDQQTFMSIAITSTQDLSDILPPVWAAVWNPTVPHPGCLPGTRADVIEQIVSWALEPKSELSMFWLAGLAGTGKSAIAKSVCEEIAKRGDTVLATFFASKSSRERSDPFRVLHSFLYQLADADTTFLKHLRSNLPVEKDISQWSFPEQVDRLLKASFAATYDSHDPAPVAVLVIDGLDELEIINGVDSQDLITGLISTLRGLPLKLILASRPDAHLMNTFRTLDLDKSMLELHRIPEAMFSHDIRSIYVNAFAEITLSHRLVESWPSEHALSNLVHLTGNLPILASSVLKYVGDTQYSPMARLQLVLESAGFNKSSEDSPFVQVDSMYMEILIHAVTDKDETINLERCRNLRRLLRVIISVQTDDVSINISDLALILRSSESDIRHDVNALSSVLITRNSDDGQPVLRIFHPSFRDFLVERCKDDHFFIGEHQQSDEPELFGDLQAFVKQRVSSGYDHQADHDIALNDPNTLHPPLLPKGNDSSSAGIVPSPILSFDGMTADQVQLWLDCNPDHLLRPTAVSRLVQLASQDDHIIPTGLLIYGVRITQSRPVGGGSFADVFKGVYEEEDVAIKRLRTYAMELGDASKLIRRFYREAVIWRQLRHAQILSFLGVDGDALLEDADAMGMVSPWMTQGTLFQYLRQPLQPGTSKHRDFIVNIAAGLGYLHAQPFVHGDLHDSNIFINDRHQAILGDFGLTAIDDPSDLAPTTSSNNAGAIRWLSPELLCVDNTPPRKTAPGDIFAFGRVCLTVYTRSQPWRNISDVNVILKVLRNEHPSRPSEADCHGTAMPDALWNLMLRCWRTDHNARPDIKQVISALGVIEFGMT